MYRTIRKYLSEKREQKEIIDGKVISRDIFGRVTVQTATGTFKAVDLRGRGTTSVMINNTAQNQNEFAIIAGNQERNIVQPTYYDLPIKTNQIAVVDVNNYRIQIFDKNGNYSKQFGNEIAFGMIRDITVDDEGNFYITESYPGYEVHKYNSEGVYISTKSFSDPFGIDYRNGYVYVADGNISKCDKDLNIIQSFDIKGTTVPYKNPYDVAIDSNNNFIVTSDDAHIVRSYTSLGILQFTIGTAGISGSNDGKFWSPRGIAVDSQDNIYVCDAFNNRIQKFDSSGNFILKFGSSGNGNGEFNLPWFIAIDDDDHIYVTDLHNHRVQIFTNSGVFIKSFGSEGNENGQFNMTMGICFSGE